MVDYYFWALEDLQTRLPFICERRIKDIGCIDGNGQGYNGDANRGESGDLCLPWNSPFATMVLDPQNIKQLGPDLSHNNCRNPDGDVSPWCIAPNGEFDYCDIPTCGGVTNNPVSNFRCAANEFQCKTSPNECILASYVCDGFTDCSNGADEDECTGQGNLLEEYQKHPGSRLDVPYLERWLETHAKGCAKYCAQASDFTCRSFNYQAAKRLCVLNELNIGQSGKMEPDNQWDYYELKSETTSCEAQLMCKNGKCLNKDHICDGKLDCGDPNDRTDEESCPNLAKVEIRLVDDQGRANQGYVEIRSQDYPFGGICDDGFRKEEADVICRMAGNSYLNSA